MLSARRNQVVTTFDFVSCRTFLGCWGAFFCCLSMTAAADPSADDFFERTVRPLLVERCSECHGAKKQEGGLRVDSRAAMLATGSEGRWVVPGDVTESTLLDAVRGRGDFRMPPDDPLNEREIRSLEEWVALGAPWPDEPRAAGVQEDGREHEREAHEHWAFQPVHAPALPHPSSHPVRNSIDSFLFARLERDALRASAPADRRSLIRRLSYALTGLPPTSAEVAAFVVDDRVDAYERLVDRLLASPAYGERWARHWLDVARYSDTKGYVYAREERFWVHAWNYRDWVGRAFNQDLPYDRFLLLQLAAEQVSDPESPDLAALGFLTIGRRFLGVTRDIIDDRIDVVSRGTMGLTVACARCHDHKYDPIPTADYYSLYGVFDSCAEELVRLPPGPAAPPGDFEDGLQEREKAFHERLQAERQASSQRARARVADYLRAQLELEKYPAAGFDQILQKSDLLPAFVRRWQRHLHRTAKTQDPVFTTWHAYADLPADRFSEHAVAVHRQLASAAPGTVDPYVARAFATVPTSFSDVVERYGRLFQSVISEDAAEGQTLRDVLFRVGGPSVVPNESLVHIETYFDTATCESLWKLRGEVDRWIIKSTHEVPYALTMTDLSAPVTPRVFHRGDPLRLGPEVPRRFLSLFSAPALPFELGSGRLELARAIIDPQNPLTARVIVNRIWAHHFGVGLVPTTSDFGTRAERPSHPGLLDWLAGRLIEEGWSLKLLHRRIVLSEAYRQSSTGEGATEALQIDPNNRLLWRMPSRRLGFEELRDSLLAVTDTLDRRLGGKPTDLFKAPYPRRRSLYGLIDRQFLASHLRTFDFANPDLHVPRRSETTVPQQALFFLNHPFMLSQARALANVVAGSSRSGSDQSIRRLFQRALQREPTERELTEAQQFLALAPSQARSAADAQLSALEQLAHTLLCSNEFLFVD